MNVRNIKIKLKSYIIFEEKTQNKNQIARNINILFNDIKFYYNILSVVFGVL